jgi:hypothetical protein
MMKQTLARRVPMALGVCVLSVGGSVLLGGTAFAATNNIGGAGGAGGTASAKCGVPVGLSGAVLGQSGNVSQCNATGGAGGAGGAGEGGAAY